MEQMEVGHNQEDDMIVGGSRAHSFHYIEKMHLLISLATLDYSFAVKCQPKLLHRSALFCRLSDVEETDCCQGLVTGTDCKTLCTKSIQVLVDTWHEVCPSYSATQTLQTIPLSPETT